jgi:hypothetical protein
MDFVLGIFTGMFFLTTIVNLFLYYKILKHNKKLESDSILSRKEIEEFKEEMTKSTSDEKIKIIKNNINERINNLEIDLKNYVNNTIDKK